MRLGKFPPADPAKRRAWCRAAKRAEEAGLGVFVPGRRGRPTRWAAGGVDPLTKLPVSYAGARPQKEATMGPEFFQTPMGRTFFDATMPRLVRVLEALCDAVDPLRAKPEYEFALTRCRLPLGDKVEPLKPPSDVSGWRVRSLTSDDGGLIVALWERPIPITRTGAHNLDGPKQGGPYR